MNMSFECCIKCERRHPGCHAECVEYAEVKSAYDAGRKKEMDARKAEGSVKTYFKESCARKRRSR